MKKIKVQGWSKNASSFATAFRIRGIHLEDHCLVDKQTRFHANHGCGFIDSTLYCVQCYMFRLSGKQSSGSGIIMIYKK